MRSCRDAAACACKGIFKVQMRFCALALLLGAPARAAAAASWDASSWQLWVVICAAGIVVLMLCICVFTLLRLRKIRGSKIPQSVVQIAS